jgi:receptor protein-tyrosine kinase
MAGNRIDMIERAAARLRRDAPQQKPVIDQGAAAANPAVAGQGAAAGQSAPVGSIAPTPAAPPLTNRLAPNIQPPNLGGFANRSQPLVNNLQSPAFTRTPIAPSATGGPRPVEPPPVAESTPAPAKTSRSVVLDTARLALAGTVDWTADRTPVMEELRLIKRRLLRRAFDEANGPDSISHLVMITSAKPREGKTFTSTNIAISISLEEDYNVLLVDADVRRQALRQNLGLEANQGFVDLLLNPGLDMADVLLRTNIPRLSILPAGMMSDRAPELLASSRMRDLIDDMAQRYRDRIIIFDTAPCLVSSDAATLAAHVGQIVFVVEAEQTQQHEIVAALNLISACPDISLVLNKAQPLATTSYGGYGAY